MSVSWILDPFPYFSCILSSGQVPDPVRVVSKLLGSILQLQLDHILGRQQSAQVVERL